MPTFPSHWAPCSGSIEPSESPLQTAQRELLEETNCTAKPQPHGMYVDVKVSSHKCIRVYPFAVPIQDENIQLRGTEHDRFQFVSLTQLEALQPAVPALAQAFHHATHGTFKELPDKVRQWAADRESGAATMALNALQLLEDDKDDHLQAQDFLMLRPTMVTITAALLRVELQQQQPSQVIRDLQDATQQAVELALVQNIQPLLDGIHNKKTLTIGTFSRSSTVTAILQRLLQERDDIHILCSKSTPGDEGVLMARDLKAECVDDEDMLKRVEELDLVLVGADCIAPTVVVNKVGTSRLAQAARAAGCPVYSCADAFKVWDDMFPPPLEDIFEEIDRTMFSNIIVPEGECTS